MKHYKNKRITLKTILFFIVVLSVCTFSVFIFEKNSQDSLKSTTSSIVSLSKTIISPSDSSLKENWKDILTDQSSNVNIAVYNHKTKQTTFYTNDKSATYYTASIVKVSILANLLRQHEKNGTSLSSTEWTLAQKMIENSNNDSATTLLNSYEGGYTAPDTLFNELNMNDSTMNSSSWGLTTTSSRDQLKLLNSLAYGKKSNLEDTDRNYVLGLMSNVESDQFWGISSGVADNATIELKNGWLEYGNGWIINSIGHIKTSNSNYTIAILTNENVTESDGIDLVEKLSSTTAKALNAD